MSMAARFKSNFAYLLGDQVFGLIMSFTALMINTRALGFEQFGMLVLIQTASQILTKLLVIKTWQTVIRFGAEDKAEKNLHRLKARYFFAFKIDFFMGIMSTALAMIFIYSYGDKIGLTKDILPFAALYALTGLFRGIDASTGMIRLFGNFRLLTIINLSIVFVLLVNAVVLAIIGATLPVYVITIAIVTAAGGLGVNGMSYFWLRRYIKDNPAPEGVRQDTSFDRREMINFAMANTGVSFIAMMRNKVEVIIVGALIGAQAAGVFAIAYRLSALVSRGAEASRLAIYPEIASAVTEEGGDVASSFVTKMVTITLAVCVPILIGIAIAGGWGMSIIFGAEAAEAHWSLFWLSLGFAFAAAAVSIEPLIQMERGATIFLIANCISFVGFILGAVLGPYWFGLNGAGLGATFYGLLILPISYYISLRGRTPTEWSLAKTLARATLNVFPRKLQVQISCYRAKKFWPNIDNPQNFRDVIASRMVMYGPGSSMGKLMVETGSKLTIRDFAARKGYAGNLPKLIDLLRNEEAIKSFEYKAPCVLKSAHGSGMNIFLKKAPSQEDLENYRTEMLRWYKSQGVRRSGEWWYDKGPRAILVEELLDENGKPPKDYKFFSVGGRAKLIQVDFDRFGDHRRNVYWRNWTRAKGNKNRPDGPVMEKPESYDQMLKIVDDLSQDFDFVRVDLYSLPDGRILIGEMTHAPGAGWQDFSDPEVSETLFEAYKLAKVEFDARAAKPKTT